MNHRAAQSQVLLAAILLCFGGLASAQDSYLARWQAVRARQPQAVTFQISAAKSEFYLGELIPLELSFTSTQPKAFSADTRLQDRVGRMNGTEEFLVAPAALTEDPLLGLPGQTGGMGGLSGGPMLLSDKPFTIERLLNEWVRFRKPGEYRIAVLSRRVTPADPTRSEYYLQTHPGGAPLELVSNILTIDIVPAPAAWVKRQIADAVGVLNAPADLSEETRQRRLRAVRTLRFLDSPEAAIELARHLGSGDDVDSWSLHMGVLGSPYRKQLLPVLEARFLAPDQPVWNRYLDTLTRLSDLVAAGHTRKEYAARLIASLPSKEPQARVISLNTLLDSTNHDGGDASWLPPVAASIIADFRSLPSNMQTNLLLSRWNIIGSPAMLPVLREIYAYPLEQQAARDIAVRRIYELAPEEGRRIVLSQLAGQNTYLSLSTLEMLPDRNLPELNDILASRLEAGQYADSLILRYATGDIVQRVEQGYLKRNQELDQQKLPHCGGPLIYYFLQYDAAFGEKELRSDMNKPAAVPACYDIGFQFQSLDRNAYSPALERLAIEFLSSPKVPVKRGAAEVLGKYGSPAAQKPLWDTLEYFHSWWMGREEQLDEQSGQEGAQFERALRIALAQADGWVLQEDGLNRLLALCSSNWCKQEIGEWLAHAKSPIEIRVMAGADGFQATMALYDIHSAGQMRSKVQQFPKGTVFRIVPVPYGDKRDRSAIEQADEIVRSAGYSLAPQ
jgi:hypothetical protein